MRYSTCLDKKLALKMMDLQQSSVPGIPPYNFGVSSFDICICFYFAYPNVLKQQNQ